MRYEFVGKESKLFGKTLWEILGNLKNFGVGRLIRISDAPNEPLPSFIKILDVQPVPPQKKEFQNRCVIAVIDEIFNGCRKPVRQICKSTATAKFQLIPKIEEEEYLKRAEGLKAPVKYISRYCFCPPLFKILWKQEISHNGEVPKIKTMIGEYKGFEIVLQDQELQPNSCSLYKTNMTVDEMYQEIVRLKKIIKSNKNLQQ